MGITEIKEISEITEIKKNENIVNKKNMLRRLKIRKSLNRYDKFDTKFYNKVQNGFLKLSKKNIKKYQIINSNLEELLI